MVDESGHITRLGSQVIKGMAVMMMILHHLSLNSDIRMRGLVLSTNQLDAVGAFFKLCLPMFVFCTGYAMAMYYDRHEPEIRVVLGRLKSLWLKFLPYFIVCVTVKYLLLHHPLPAYMDPVMWVASLLGIQKLFRYDSLGLIGSWWYMTTAYILIVIAPFFRQAIREGDRLWLLLPCSFLLPPVLNIPYQGTGLLVPWLPAFVFGMCVYRFRLAGRIRDLRLLPAIVCVLVSYVLGHALHEYGYDYWFVSLPLPFFLAGLYGITARLHLTRLIGYIGRYSTGIWLTHSFVYSVLPACTIQLGAIHWFLAFITTLLLALALSISVEWLRKQFARCMTAFR